MPTFDDIGNANSPLFSSVALETNYTGFSFSWGSPVPTARRASEAAQSAHHARVCTFRPEAGAFPFYFLSVRNRSANPLFALCAVLAPSRRRSVGRPEPNPGKDLASRA